MKRILHHLIIPSIIPALFFVVAAMPVEVLGCRNRGLLAVVIALAGALVGLGVAILGARKKLRGDPDTHWWIASSLILAIPAVAVIMIAYSG